MLNSVSVKGPLSIDRLFDRLFLLWKFAFLIVAKRSNWMNFSFSGIFIRETCSAARNACRLRWAFKSSVLGVVGMKVTFCAVRLYVLLYCA